MYELWPFQRDVVAATQKALQTHRAVCIVLPTGSGKTVIVGNMSVRIAAQLSGRKGGIALYCVHRKELLRQTIRTLEECGLGDQIGVIASGWPSTPWAPLQVTSIPTLVRRLDILTWLDPAVVFFDEAHHIAAGTWERIVNHFPNAFRIGTTATPCRLDGKGLGKYFTTLVQGPQMRELIPNYLCPVQMFSIPPGYDLKQAKGGREYNKRKLGTMQTGPIVANLITNWRKWAGERKTIFFCVNRDHSKHTVERLQGLGIKSAHVDFKTPGNLRERLFDDFQNGDLQCMSNVELFTEGVDAPACAAVVLGRPTLSFPLYKQMVGRGTRKKPDGGDCIVVDAAGNEAIHGHPTEDVPWELEYGVGEVERTSIRNSSRVCEFCNYCYDIKEPACPLCGSEPIKKEVNEVDLELVPTGGGPPPRPTKRALSRAILQTGGDLDKLKNLARTYGYGDDWARRMQSVYGFGWKRDEVRDTHTRRLL